MQTNQHHINLDKSYLLHNHSYKNYHYHNISIHKSVIHYQQNNHQGIQLNNHLLYYLNNNMLTNCKLVHIIYLCYQYMYEELLNLGKMERMSMWNHLRNNREFMDILLRILMLSYRRMIYRNHYGNIFINNFLLCYQHMWIMRLGMYGHIYEWVYQQMFLNCMDNQEGKVWLSYQHTNQG